MASADFEFLVSDADRDIAAVYAVAMGNHLGLSGAKLLALRKAVEGSTATGDSQLDSIIEFVDKHSAAGILTSYPVPDSIPRDRLGRALRAVAAVIQPRREGVRPARQGKRPNQD